MYYAYVLQSEADNSHFYYGSTDDLRRRVKAHNAGQSPHTAKHRPWRVVWYGAFMSKEKSLRFEQYLKTASGKAFSRKRLLDK